MTTKETLEKKLLHYTGKAIQDFRMIQTGDRVLACVSGGKDSFALLYLLNQLKMRSNGKFELFSLTLDPGFSNWDDTAFRTWCDQHGILHDIVKTDIFNIVRSKIKPNKSCCSFCSRLRRGIIYTYAKKHGFQKIALGHHRDDLITSLLMSICYSGEIRSMPPKLLTNTKQQIVIRPLVYCQERDIISYVAAKQLPLFSYGCPLERAQSTRTSVHELIEQLAKQNPKVPSNMLHALQNIQLSQLMDKRWINFKTLDDQLID